jgi:hypothetical protein
MTSAALSIRWPSARDFMEAVQSPGSCFFRDDLRESQPAVDRLGMPLVATGQFAYVFKLRQPGGRVTAVRCFRSFLADRHERYRRISARVAARPVPCLANFQYDPEGILVNSRTYPTLMLEWVEGQTLDVFIEQALSSPETMRSLADQWLRLVTVLRDAEVAHGDLQHGNILVDSLGLRLVDPDGMFVPSLSGWESSELGHRHYQHPLRDTHFFGPCLDNFSALVIYLSLISIADKPSLWSRYHDENLLFKASDFKDPSGSELFEETRAISPEHWRLTETLEQACKSDPAGVPNLTDLVSPRSRLPWWMLAPASLDDKVRSREASGDSAAPAVIQVASQNPAGMVNTAPWQPSANVSAAALKPIGAGMSGTRTQQTIGVGKRAAATPNPFPTLSLYENQDTGVLERLGNSLESLVLERFKISGIPWSGFAYSLVVAYLGIFVSWIWFPIFDLFYSAFGANRTDAETLASVTYLVMCMATGFAYAIRRERKKNSSGVAPPAAGVPTSTPPNVAAPLALPIATPATAAPAAQQAVRTPARNVRIIGNSITLKYHRSSCWWALGIFGVNLRTFASIKQAEAEGFRRCKECLP